MIQLDQLGLMTFPRASERWNKERSYVYQQYKKYPEKFLPGSIAYLNGSGSGGTLIITREGMEHLTGQTEAEASNELWEAIVMKQSNIIEQKQAVTEEEIFEQMLQMIDDHARDEMIDGGITYDYLDAQKKNFGVRLKNGTTIYYKNIRRGSLPDEMKAGNLTAFRRGLDFIIKDEESFEIAGISLTGEIDLYYPNTPKEMIDQLEMIAAKISQYDQKE
ncbi:helix-turn-helix domain-containing protein [uncultured Enterococcus sp.]|uniref:helix-turn-helix domain-containing protein n=1 Tax=uncultured Enterococcus sp. TaxID=167972 RepID=UPI002AA902EB|nr:helix-turn-helix domain-containing protein [uncultured Enterococcus sp.]